MKKKVLPLLCASISTALLLSACSTSAPGADPSQAQSSAPTAVTYSWEFLKAANDLDEIKATPSQEKGTVVSLEYDTPAYAVNHIFGVDETLHKSVNIYLPYGYDETQQYNVLYLLHGTEGENDGPMEEFWLKQWGESTCNVLDYMIQQGLCDPVIVVTPNYYSQVEGYEITDEQMATLAQEKSDSFLHTETAETGGEPDNVQNLWPAFFGEELRNNIIPAVESTYSTYAKGDVTVENLVATRDHRAFAGLSRGSMTVLRAGFITNTDLFAYFGNFSGSWTEFSQFQEALEGPFANYDVKFWYNGNGRGDFALENHKEFVTQALSDMSDRFVDGENYAWISLANGAHMYSSWLVHLYNSMLVFFR